MTKEMVRICLPKGHRGQEPEVFVGVNGFGYRISRGVEVEVPAAVAEILHNSQEAESRNNRFLEDNWDTTYD